MEVIENYLPKQMSEEEVEAVVKQLITDTGAAGMKDMGKVMGAATKQLAGQADGKIVSAVVKKLLS
ncbi:glutamyl-tRNA(Gln) amidotransferase subunit E [compost metagenome]